MEKVKIQDTTLIGKWEEVDKINASKITGQGDEVLSGLIIYGYEMKWGKSANQNGEIYDEGAFDEFINEYFVTGGFNMPVTINHSNALEDLCGRVLYIERNSVGFYFVVYVPKTYINYALVKNLLKEGILQGFSKEGFAVDYEYTESGMHIKKMDIINVSIVSTPANMIHFESAKETKDKLTFNVKKDENENKQTSLFDEIFS